MKNKLYITNKYLISDKKSFSCFFYHLLCVFLIFVLFLYGCSNKDSDEITDINTTLSSINNDTIDKEDNTTVNTDTTVTDNNTVDVTTDNSINYTTVINNNTEANNTNNNDTISINNTITTNSNINNNPTEMSTTKSGNILSVETPITDSNNDIPTLLSFLKNAIMPVGTTMYVWGGGWNEADTGAGLEAMSIGLSSTWINFYNSQNSSYNHEFHRYEIHNGLDCSGYVGWVLYNTFGNKYSNTGYVYKSSTITSKLSSMGFGNYITSYTYDFKPGDICSMAKHVWICLGTCSDGSILVLHSSPPGVRLCGTLLSDGSVSEAVLLAQETMQKYYPNWYSRYPDCSSNYSFITSSSKLRMSESVLKDPDGLRNLNAYQIIDYLFK